MTILPRSGKLIFARSGPFSHTQPQCILFNTFLVQRKCKVENCVPHFPDHSPHTITLHGNTPPTSHSSHITHLPHHTLTSAMLRAHLYSSHITLLPHHTPHTSHSSHITLLTHHTSHSSHITLLPHHTPPTSHYSHITPSPQRY